MNQNQGDQSFTSSDVAPNPFLNGPDQGVIPTIPGFDMGVAKKSPINFHGVLTVGILVIAGVAIWGMRSIGLKGLQGGVIPTETGGLIVDPGARPAVMTVEDQRLLADLNASRTTNQVPNNDLQKNPFALSAAARPRSKAAVNAPMDPGATQEQIAEARQQELLGYLADYKLQGVMGGSKGVARINGKPYRVGDKLGDNPSGKPGDAGNGRGTHPQFTISAIEGREVSLTLEGFTFILSMDGQ